MSENATWLETPRAGADAIKFQTHIAAAESTVHEPWRTPFSSQDKTRLDYWRRMEFPEEGWRELREHAGERGLLFLSSPFSFEALKLLDLGNSPTHTTGKGIVESMSWYLSNITSSQADECNKG